MCDFGGAEGAASGSIDETGALGFSVAKVGVASGTDAAADVELVCKYEGAFVVVFALLSRLERLPLTIGGAGTGISPASARFEWLMGSSETTLWWSADSKTSGTS